MDWLRPGEYNNCAAKDDVTFSPIDVTVNTDDVTFVVTAEARPCELVSCLIVCLPTGGRDFDIAAWVARNWAIVGERLVLTAELPVNDA